MRLYLDTLDQFLDDYPGMSTVPFVGNHLCLQGLFHFRARVIGKTIVDDMYSLKITVPINFPSDIPVVIETGGKIPRREVFHINESDKSLCLGSPLRLLGILNKYPTLSGFAEKCLEPYLYAVSCKLQNNEDFAFGELAHGEQGIMEDYSQLLGLKDDDQVCQAIHLLGLKKRIANKQLCPCGCGNRLGVCRFHFKMNEFRKMAAPSWFRRNALP